MKNKSNHWQVNIIKSVRKFNRAEQIINPKKSQKKFDWRKESDQD